MYVFGIACMDFFIAVKQQKMGHWNHFSVDNSVVSVHSQYSVTIPSRFQNLPPPFTQTLCPRV